jgi:hypothetical protein
MKGLDYVVAPRNRNPFQERGFKMKWKKVLLAGVAVLALLLFTTAPAARAQDLEDTTHQAKFSSSAIVYVPGQGFIKEGGKENLQFVLRDPILNADTGGFDYAIHLLIETEAGIDCVEEDVGTFTTYAGETEGFADIEVDGFPNPGQILIGHFFTKIKNKPGKSSFKTVAGWTEVGDDNDPDPDGISKKASLSAKEKTPDKLGLECSVAITP